MTSYIIPTPPGAGMNGNYQPALNARQRADGNSSVLVSAEYVSPGVIRAPRGTNPVNQTPEGARMAVPLAGGVGVVPGDQTRAIHPKMNTVPWSTSMAQTRTEPKTGRARGKVNRRRRNGKYK